MQYGMPIREWLQLVRQLAYIIHIYKEESKKKKHDPKQTEKQTGHVLTTR